MNPDSLSPATPAPESQVPGYVGSVPSFGGYALAEEGFEGATFLPRVIARAIDLILHYGISYLAASLFGFMLRAATAGHLPMWAAFRLAHVGLPMFVSRFLGAYAYQVICTTVYGATLGKRVVGLRVVQDDGSPCRIRAALVREAAFLVDSICFGLVGYMAMQRSIRQKRYGDEWADTVVLELSKVPEASRRGGDRFVIGLMFGMMADIALMMLGMLAQLNA